MEKVFSIHFGTIILTILSLILGVTVGVVSVSSPLQVEGEYVGSDAYKDQFEIIDVEALAEAESIVAAVNETDILGLTDELPYMVGSVDLPLIKKDYYRGKYENGRAGANQINNMPLLTPGMRISLIKDKYINVSKKSGYIKPQRGFGFGSGLCWSTSALGQLMDFTNYKFIQKYGIPLFVYNNRDRSPHSKKYATYKDSNNGRGYAVLQKKRGGLDYSFAVNPTIATIDGLAQLKIKLVLTSTASHPTADRGQSIGGYLLSNIEF